MNLMNSLLGVVIILMTLLSMVIAFRKIAQYNIVGKVFTWGGILVAIQILVYVFNTLLPTGQEGILTVLVTIFNVVFYYVGAESFFLKDKSNKTWLQALVELKDKCISFITKCLKEPKSLKKLVDKVKEDKKAQRWFIGVASIAVVVLLVGTFGQNKNIQAGDSYYLQRDYENALEQYKIARDANPTDARAIEKYTYTEKMMNYQEFYDEYYKVPFTSKYSRLPELKDAIEADLKNIKDPVIKVNFQSAFDKLQADYESSKK